MNKDKKKLFFILGVVLAVLMGLSVWYSVAYNESRLVAPTNLAEYTFCLKDLPMILSGVLLVLYLLSLFACLLLHRVKAKGGQANSTHTRTISPKLGLLGLLGFLGLSGFVIYPITGDIFPFLFFVFFGFFSFYYEGKMSGTLIDERYRENRLRAQLKANRIFTSIIFLSLLILGQGRFHGNLEYTLIAFVIVVSLAVALELFLSMYLLYRYDQGGSLEEEGE